MEDIYYIIRNNEIHKAQFIKKSKRGFWFKIDYMQGNILVSARNIFDDEISAKNSLIELREQRKERKDKQVAKYENELKEIDEIMSKLYDNFGYEVKFLNKPCTIEDAKTLYNKVKKSYYENKAEIPNGN